MSPDPLLAFPASRRRVLAWGSIALIGGAGALGGCTAGGSVQPAAAGTRPPDPHQLAQDALRQQARADEEELLAAYRRTQARHPTLRAVLAVPYAQHSVHLRALAPGRPDATATPARQTSGSKSPGPLAGGATPTPVPSDPALALRTLAALEQTVARRRRTACATATGELAGLLGSLGACEAAHAELLGAG